MKIKDILLPEDMIMNLKATDKQDAISEMADLAADKGIVNNKAEFIKSIWKREDETTTGIGDGIAMPHAHNRFINKTRVLFSKSKAGINYDSIDGKPVNLLFMIVAPEGADSEHMRVLAELSSLLIEPAVLEALNKASTAQEVVSIFDKAETAKDSKDKQSDKADDRPLIVGVTACVNGIAHTYMAQEALIKAGEKRGARVRIETNGSEGVKDKLTSEEISRAKGVIIASDKKVDMPRFNGKPLAMHPVIDGINKPDELIDEILTGKASIYQASENSGKARNTDHQGKGVWQKIYQSLMNGVSHMLPFVIGGGILMAISFIVENYAGGPKSPAFIFLNNTGNMAFAFMVPVLSGYIAEAIGDLPALMPGFVGGFMATVYSGAYGGSYTANVIANAKSPAGFLGGLAAGFLAGYIVVGLKKLCEKLPSSLSGIKPMLIYPILSLLLIALVMYYVINPIFSALNFAITDFLNQMGTGNLTILTTLLAAMMSIDMGGPFNKAAYVFASGAFANDPHSSIAAIMMAAVMVGGMIPPFATAISTTFFKNKYTEDDRRAGLVNWILGFSFITEGAISFAASDAGHVIPSCVIGSAVGGVLVGFWHIGVPAPHGGLWVSPLATNALLYFAAVIIGSLVAGIILGLWKKPLKDNSIL